MKKIFYTIIAMSLFCLSVFADDKSEAQAFFNKYMNAANNYDPVITTLYSPSAKIIRQVVKPDGTTANAYTDTKTYITQMKLGQAGARLRGYKNKYSNIVITPISAGKVKVSAMRQPAGENYNLKTYMILQKQANGNWLIVEEMMQTKVQLFLKYAK